jgi:hypothetical protein
LTIKVKKMKKSSMNPNKALNEASQAKKKIENLQKKIESIRDETREPAQRVQDAVSSAKATKEKVSEPYNNFSKLIGKLVVANADNASLNESRALCVEKEKRRRNPKLSFSF